MALRALARTGPGFPPHSLFAQTIPPAPLVPRILSHYQADSHCKPSALAVSSAWDAPPSQNHCAVNSFPGLRLSSDDIFKDMSPDHAKETSYMPVTHIYYIHSTYH